MPASGGQFVAFIERSQFQFANDKILLEDAEWTPLRFVAVRFSLTEYRPFDVEI